MTGIADKATTLIAVIDDLQRLRLLALRDGLESVAGLCEDTIHEARAQLAWLGPPHDPEPTLADDDPKVVTLR